MAIRERRGRASPWQVYWNNPITGRRESASFETRMEAEKHDSLIKHRLRFERESFRETHEVGEQSAEEITLEAAYLLYLKEKQFSKKGLSWQMDAMRLPLRTIGTLPIRKIEQSHIRAVMEQMASANVKPVTVRARMSVLRTVLRWAAAMGLRESVTFPKLPAAHYERLVPPTVEELSNLLLVAPPHIARVIILGAKCGVRVGPSELFRLTWA
ncbi:MAG: site-specific integrase, partial [Desulfovibrio sp.]|nr:site-specific integrase [Desulfovibrio sp.]